MSFLVLAFLVAQADMKPADFFAPNDEVRAYVQQAIDGGAQHPELAASYEEYLAGVDPIVQATSLDDPMFEAGYFVRSSSGQGRYSVMLSQMFPWFGTLKTRGKQAEAEADAKMADFCMKRNARIAEIKKAYVEYAFLADNVRITQSQAEILKYVEDIARSRYALGIGGQEDLLRIQTEQTKLQDAYAGFLQYQPALAAKLNAALGNEGAVELPLPQPMQLPPPPPPAPIVLARIRVTNPQITKADAEIEGREHNIALAKKKGYPNFTLGLQYTDMKDLRNEPRTGATLSAFDSSLRLANPARPLLPTVPTGNNALERALNYVGQSSAIRQNNVETGVQGAMDLDSFRELENALDNQKMKDEVMVTLEMNLPIWRSKVKAGIHEAEHMKKAAEHEKRRVSVSLDADARMDLFSIQDGYRRVKLYEETLIPQAQKTYDAVQAAYSSGSGTGFLDLLTSTQTILEFQLEKARATRDVQVASADLEMLMGGPWSESPDSTVDANTPASPAPTPSPEPVAPAAAETKQDTPVAPLKDATPAK